MKICYKDKSFRSGSLGVIEDANRILDAYAAQEYLSQFGQTCWELDALKPRIIESLVDQKISEFVDQDMMNERKRERSEKRRVLQWISENSWDVFEYAEHRMENE